MLQLLINVLRKILIEELSIDKSGYSALTEETGKIEGEKKNNRWIIDPIDGTTNFLNGVPHFVFPLHMRKMEI